jgi:hypothetical protein
MCVVLEALDEKIVKLPPFPVTATRINDLELQIQRIEYQLQWVAAEGRFEITETGGDVQIVPATAKRPAQNTNPPPEDYATSFRVVSTAIVNGYAYVTVHFLRPDGTMAFTGTYIYIGGEYWARDPNGVWTATTDFTEGSFRPGILPPAPLNPPPRGEEGGGNQEQN